VTEGSIGIYALRFTHSVWWRLVLTETRRKNITLSRVVYSKLCADVVQYCITAYYFEVFLSLFSNLILKHLQAWKDSK